MPDLALPTTDLHPSWFEAHAEWGPGLHEDGFGLLPTDEIESPRGFEAWVARLTDEPDHWNTNGTRCIYRWIVEGGKVLGGIALRYGSDETVMRTGHIGFGIRPSARQRGVATWALGRMLDDARGLGMDRVLLVCAEDNVGSAKTIERHGGVLESIQDTKLGLARRYWVTIGSRSTTSI
ncbi:GNAT family N-acetyltransferase [Nocardia uniformis]|uniref:GNAT family N-acetyltransferase n=1 Tax=Nocardia uniformis TaxID=53432 RepID=A0A849BYP9_9NOCA|nr:GNAT family N-acetyltransferase [Nocardia uniformis]NNH71414.1 GNAT family N-acetyltransferase [Nocardia uniformis]